MTDNRNLHHKNTLSIQTNPGLITRPILPYPLAVKSLSEQLRLSNRPSAITSLPPQQEAEGKRQAYINYSHNCRLFTYHKRLLAPVATQPLQAENNLYISKLYNRTNDYDRYLGKFRADP